MGKSSGDSPPAIQQLAAPVIPQIPQTYVAPLPPREPVPLPPAIERVNIDVSERQEQLLSKARADFATDQAAKKTRTSTIKTSSLLDDEDVTTTGLLT